MWYLYGLHLFLEGNLVEVHGKIQRCIPRTLFVLLHTLCYIPCHAPSFPHNFHDSVKGEGSAFPNKLIRISHATTMIRWISCHQRCDVYKSEKCILNVFVCMCKGFYGERKHSKTFMQPLDSWLIVSFPNMMHTHTCYLQYVIHCSNQFPWGHECWLLLRQLSLRCVPGQTQRKAYTVWELTGLKLDRLFTD